MSTLPHTAMVALNDTLGAAFIGHTVTIFLYGITTLQTFMYYRHSPQDSPILKASVGSLWLLDSFHAALVTGAVYWYCITNFTNLQAIYRPIWPINTVIIVSNFSNSIVRGIFCHRLYLLGHRSLWLPTIIGAISVFIIVDAVYFSSKLFSMDSFERITEFSWGLYSGLAVEAAVDMVVAISQCVLLRKFETGIRSTDSSIRVLMKYSINTGFLTSFCAVGAVVSFAVAPCKFIYFAFYFVLSKMYVNSLLATLNARESILRKGPDRRRRAVTGNKEAVLRSAGATTGTVRNGALSTFDGIEFTSIISTPQFVSDSIVEDTKAKTRSSSDTSECIRTV